jgi:branched-chain amino acid transport system substrate-binding protein
MKAFIQWTNAHGGVNGYCLKYTFLDDQNTPTLALSDVKQLVQQNHIIALLGSLDQNTSWTSYIDSVGVPVIGGAQDIVQYATDKNFYPTGGTILSLLEGLEVQAKAAGQPKIAVFSCNNFAACTSVPGLFKLNASKTGAQIVYAGSFNNLAPSYTSLCLAAKQAGAQAVYVTGTAMSYKQVSQQCGLQSFTPSFIAADATMSGDMSGKGGLNHAIFDTADFPFFDNSTPAEQEFHSALKQYYPNIDLTTDEGTDFLSLQWTSGELFKAAAEMGGLGANPTPAQVKAGLAKIQNNTLNGLAPALTFTPGQPNPGASCYFVEGMTNTQFTLPQGLKTSCVPS